MLGSLFDNRGDFGMFCLLSAVFGFLGNCAGRGLELFAADVQNEESPRVRKMPRLSSLLGWFGFLLPTLMEIVGFFLARR